MAKKVNRGLDNVGRDVYTTGIIQDYGGGKDGFELTET